MNVDKNIHQGHRKRMFEKALKYSDALSDHELLEIILFYAIPRVDTNGIAHSILRTFGSLKKTLQAPVNSLMAIEGVGEKSAILIHTIGKLLVRANKDEKKVCINNHEQLRKVVIPIFEGLDREICTVIMLDKSFKVISRLDYDNTEKFSVSVKTNEVVDSFNAVKPKHVILAHNHVSESCSPSEEDDIASKKFNVICSLHGINFVDHVIVRGNDMFSYRMNGLMEMIKDKADIENVLKSGGLF